LYDSRQIRPPIYSLKQTKLRKRRVIRFAILYFALLILFIVLIAVPLVLRDIGLKFDVNIMQLMQPINQDNNDTTSAYTGNNLPGGKNAPAATTGDATASATGLKMVRMMAF
jgi:hypothetical protein